MSIKVLLVDNNEDNKITSLNLAKPAYETYIADSIAQAFSIIENQTIDIILLNIINQESEAIEFCKSISDIPIIILIDPKNPDIIAKTLALGANDYTSLPINEEDIKLRIAVQINQQKHPIKSNNHYNKEDFYAKMNIHYKNSLSSKEIFSIIMVDLDDFKKINDIHGHIAGDKVLKETEQRLTQSLRNEDISARFGGDEFIIMLPTNLDNAYLVGERLRKYIEQEAFCNKNPINVTASFGIAEFNGIEALEEVINRADKALYMAKKQNKNKVIKLV